MSPFENFKDHGNTLLAFALRRGLADFPAVETSVLRPLSGLSPKAPEVDIQAGLFLNEIVDLCKVTKLLVWSHKYNAVATGEHAEIGVLFYVGIHRNHFVPSTREQFL